MLCSQLPSVRSSEATESATAVVQQPGAVPGTGAVQAQAEAA